METVAYVLQKSVDNCPYSNAEIVNAVKDKKIDIEKSIKYVLESQEKYEYFNNCKSIADGVLLNNDIFDDLDKAL
jgi:hypothetical protein